MGANVPDDWDGISYRCYRVTYPDSEKYRALLLGQISEPDTSSFWEPGSGDVDQAVSAVFHSNLVTLSEIFDTECSQMAETLRPYFRAKASSSQALNPTAYATIEFDTLLYNLNEPDFNTTFHWQDLQTAANEGLWLFNIGVGCFVGGETTIRVFHNGNDLRYTNNGKNWNTCSIIRPMVEGDTIWVSAINSDSNSTNPIETVTFFEGTWLGPLA